MRPAVALRLGRVSNLPTVWTNVAAGVALGGGEVRAAVVSLLLFGISLVYVAGMFLNDAFDREIDAVERPQRPIPAGAAGAAEVFVVGFSLLAGGVAVAAAAALPTGAAAAAKAGCAALVLAACVVAYDAFHARTRAVVLLMAACRASIYAIAALATTAHLDAAVALAMVALGAYVTGLTAVAAQEMLRRVTNAWPLGLLAVPVVIAAWLGRFEPAAIGFTAALAVWIVLAVRPLVRGGGAIPLAVARMIAGMCLLDAAFIAGCGHFGVAALAAFGVMLTRLLQRFVPGT